MTFFIRSWTDDTVILFTEFGNTIGYFDCIESAEDAARNYIVKAIPEVDRNDVVRLSGIAMQHLARA
jgi:hypothetical protein